MEYKLQNINFKFLILILFILENNSIKEKNMNIYYKQENNKFSLLFGNFINYNNFWINILNYIKNLKFYYYSLKLKGLGLRMRLYSNKLIKFKFYWNTFLYMHIPKGIILKRKKKILLFISKNKQMLNTILVHIISLLKIDFYTKKNYFNKRHRIVFLKKKINTFI